MKTESEDGEGEGRGLPRGFFSMGSITFRGNPERRRGIEERIRERDQDRTGEPGRDDA